MHTRVLWVLLIVFRAGEQASCIDGALWNSWLEDDILGVDSQDYGFLFSLWGTRYIMFIVWGVSLATTISCLHPRHLYPFLFLSFCCCSVFKTLREGKHLRKIKSSRWISKIARLALKISVVIA